MFWFMLKKQPLRGIKKTHFHKIIYIFTEQHPKSMFWGTVRRPEKMLSFYSVFRVPPNIIGCECVVAHFDNAENILPIPVSLGFSSPRIALCFMTDTNSLLDSFPSPSSSNKTKTTLLKLFLYQRKRLAILFKN